MVRLGEVVVILDLHRQGLSVSAIAARTGPDRKIVRKYIVAGLEPPAYGPRQPRPTKMAPYHALLRERVAVYPELTAVRHTARPASWATVAARPRSRSSSARSGRAWRRASRCGLKHRRAARRRSPSPISAPCSPTSPAWSRWSGCSRWCCRAYRAKTTDEIDSFFPAALLSSGCPRTTARPMCCLNPRGPPCRPTPNHAAPAGHPIAVADPASAA